MINTNKNRTRTRGFFLAMVLAATVIMTICTAGAAESAVQTGTELFTERDMEQTADLSNAVSYTIMDDDEIHITQEGVYVLSGNAAHAVIYVEASDEDKVQLVLDGLTISNDSFPCIYVTSADKVFVTTTDDSMLSVSGSFVMDGDTKTDGVIFSRSDIVLNGTAALTIVSPENGVVSKDDLKITGGTYNITAGTKALEANDSICIADGTLLLNAGTDGIHAENEEDDALGYVYIGGGDITIEAGDDAIHAVSWVQIDSGTITIRAGEGIEGTSIQINDGTVHIYASDDGINAANKSASVATVLEINGGNVVVIMDSGDTDGLDSNGNLYINGGTIEITADSAVDYDGIGEFNGGTLIVNGQQQTALPNQMMGGMGWGGSRGGGMGR